VADDDSIAARVRQVLAGRSDVRERKMFGGLAFMVAGNMCCGVTNDMLMARVGPVRYAELLERPHAREMNFTGRPLKGFVFVDRDGIRTEAEIEDWVHICLQFVGTLSAK